VVFNQSQKLLPQNIHPGPICAMATLITPYKMMVDPEGKNLPKLQFLSSAQSVECFSEIQKFIDNFTH